MKTDYLGTIWIVVTVERSRFVAFLPPSLLLLLLTTTEAEALPNVEVFLIARKDLNGFDTCTFL